MEPHRHRQGRHRQGWPRQGWHLILAICTCAIPIASGYVAKNFRGFIDDPDGVAFKADNGKFISATRPTNGKYVLKATKDYKDPSTRFLVHKADGGRKIFVECVPGNDLFLRQYTVQKITAPYRVYKATVVTCAHYPGQRGLGQENKFDVFNVGDDGSKIALRNQMDAGWKSEGRTPFMTPFMTSFMTPLLDIVLTATLALAFQPRFFGRCGPSLATCGSNSVGIYPRYASIRPESSFTLASGAILPTTYEIIDVEFTKNSQLDEVNVSPEVAASSSFRNVGAATIEHTFNLEFSEEIEETTNWESAFGGAFEASYETPKLASWATGKATFTATLTYDYKNGGSSGVKRTKTHSEEVKVNIPASSSTTVKLMIRRKSDASIPFRAKIKRVRFDATTSARRETIMYKSGTWNGVLWSSTEVVVNTTPIH